jgi:cytidine deaminase
MLNEFSLNMRVICGSRASGKITVIPLKDLLPHSFGPEDLK